MSPLDKIRNEACRIQKEHPAWDAHQVAQELEAQGMRPHPSLLESMLRPRRKLNRAGLQILLKQTKS